MTNLKFLDLSLLLLRLCFGGLMFLNHGMGKFTKLTAGGEIQFADPLGIGSTLSLYLTVGAEFVCALFFAIGFLTRWVSIPLIITMVVAAFVVHLPDPLADKEASLTYLIPYICVALLGPGRYSFDALLQKNKFKTD